MGTMCGYTTHKRPDTLLKIAPRFGFVANFHLRPFAV
jgi:hypothetical protein